MAIQKITFDGSNVTAKMDADLQHFLFSSDVGILKGLKNEVSYTLANNTITLLDGYVAVYGRLIYIENQTTVAVVPDSVKFGYVVLTVNTTTNSVTLSTKELAGSYPTLTTTNLLTTDGVYELVLCAYSKTTTSVTLNTSFQRLIISSDKERISNLETSLKNYFQLTQPTLTKQSNGVYVFQGEDSTVLQASLIIITIEFRTVLTIPGRLIFQAVGSSASVNYRYSGADYSLGVAYSNGIVTLTCGSTLHRITSLYLKK